MMQISLFTNELYRTILFSIIAVAITGISLAFFNGYGQTLVWALVLAASAGITGFIVFLSFNGKIGENDAVKYLVAGQWLTLLLFCIMSLVVGQALIDMQHRIAYNNSTMWLMILGIIMTGTNAISLVIYIRPDLLGLGVAPAKSGASFEDNVKALVNNICAANNEPRGTTSPRGAPPPPGPGSPPASRFPRSPSAPSPRRRTRSPWRSTEPPRRTLPSRRTGPRNPRSPSST
jgi:hypothetical protein